MNEEKLSTIIGIRVFPSFKEELKREAERRNMTISDFLYEIIEEGYENVKQKDVKQS
jgi:predicted DNA-binding protein